MYLTRLEPLVSVINLFPSLKHHKPLTSVLNLCVTPCMTFASIYLERMVLAAISSFRRARIYMINGKTEKKEKTEKNDR